MLEDVPARAWLFLALAVFAYPPAAYLYRHFIHSPSRRDITRPAEDLSWRTPAQFARSIALLSALLAFAVFIFTPAAEQLASSPNFLPFLVAGIGAWALYTVVAGFRSGLIEPFVRGVNQTFERQGQPKRYWASMTWNALVGCFCLWLPFSMQNQMREDRCYDYGSRHSPQDVLSACNELISETDNSNAALGDYRAGRGRAFHNIGNYRDAIADYNEAIRLSPSESYLYYNRALAFARIGNVRSAIADYNIAIRLRPDDADAHLNRGLLFLDTARFDEAAADFTKAHQLDPDDPWPLANRGVAYAWQNDIARAEKDFETIRSVTATQSVVLRGKAILAMNAGDFPAAVERLSEALRRDPKDAWSLQVRSEAYRHLGEHQKRQADIDSLARLRKN